MEESQHAANAMVPSSPRKRITWLAEDSSSGSRWQDGGKGSAGVRQVLHLFGMKGMFAEAGSGEGNAGDCRETGVGVRRLDNGP